MTDAISRRQLLYLCLAAGLPTAGCTGEDHPIVPDPDAPQGTFGADSTADEVTRGLDLSGRTALVTGCTSGLGFETLRVLAMRGCHVIGTGRTLEKAQAACARVAGTATPLALELSEFRTAVDCAAAVRALDRGLDMLVLNAGINTFGELELVHGVEKMFAVNFLGHYVLARHLVPLMTAAGGGRVVHVSSRAAWTREPAEGIDFDNLRGEKGFDAAEAYGRSKLANALFSLELAQRLAGSGVTSNAVHPGLVQTNIARTAPPLMRRAFETFGGLIAKSPAEGAATQVYVATHPTLAGVSGAFFADCNPIRVGGANHLTDRELARRLWQEAERLCAGYLPD